MTEPRIILLNDPTRGIDVGTKQELYRLMRELADDGAAILFYSTDYDELIGCCDRVPSCMTAASCASSTAPRSPRPTSIASALNIEAGAGGRGVAAGGRSCQRSGVIGCGRISRLPDRVRALRRYLLRSTSLDHPRGLLLAASCRTAAMRSCCSRWWRWRRPCRCSPAGSIFRSAR